MPTATPSTQGISTEPVLTPDHLFKLREALIRDIGSAEDWSDGDVRLMASTTLCAVTVLRRIAAAQRKRRQ